MHADDLQVVAPVREGSFTRQDEWNFLAERGLPLPDRPADRLYSVADNMWGCFRGHLADASDPGVRAPDDVYNLVQRNDDGSLPWLRVCIGFEEGVPVSLDGVAYSGPDLLAALNQTLGSAGYGAIDYVESSIYGTKIRQTVEGPAALAVITAHEDLERLTLSRRQLSTKPLLEQRWTEYVFDGLWIDPVCRDIEAFINSTQGTVNGEVTLEVQGAGLNVVSRNSPCSLYREDLYRYDDSALDSTNATVSAGTGIASISSCSLSAAAAYERSDRMRRTASRTVAARQRVDGRGCSGYRWRRCALLVGDHGPPHRR